MSNEIIELITERTCAKCGQPKGDLYSFYYGKFVSSTSTNYGKVTVRKRKYDIAGDKLAALCNECIGHHRKIRLIVFGVMTVVGAALALWAANMNTFADPARIREAVQFQMFTLGVAGILGLIGLWKLLANLLTSKKTHAENILIALKKGELRQQGFDTFWNHRDFNKLS
jgi:hypothetical protein